MAFNSTFVAKITLCLLILAEHSMCFCTSNVLIKCRLSMQQGRISDAETAVRKLWGKSKVESSMAELKAGSVETVKGDSQDAGWGELFGKRYRKGMPDCDYCARLTSSDLKNV